MKNLILICTLLFSVSTFAMPIKENSHSPKNKKIAMKKKTGKKLVKKSAKKAPASKITAKSSTKAAPAKVIQRPIHKGPPVYRITTYLTIDGVKTSQSITVKEGEKAEGKNVAEYQSGRFTEVEVVPTKLDGKRALQMEFVVGEIDAIGNKTIISTPRLVAAPGEKSSILIGSTATGKKLVLSAVAEQISR